VVTYDRSEKVYKSNIVPGSFPSRIDAETAELPPDLFASALRFEPDLERAAQAARVVMERKIYNEQRKKWTVQADSMEAEGANPLPEKGEGYYFTTLWSCTCAAYRHNIYPCKHIIAVNIFLFDAMVARRYCRPHTC